MQTNTYRIYAHYTSIFCTDGCLWLCNVYLCEDGYKDLFVLQKGHSLAWNLLCGVGWLASELWGLFPPSLLFQLWNYKSMTSFKHGFLGTELRSSWLTHLPLCILHAEMRPHPKLPLVRKRPRMPGSSLSPVPVTATPPRLHRMKWHG